MYEVRSERRISIDADFLGLLGMYFDAVVVFVTNHSLLFRLALAILCLHLISFDAKKESLQAKTFLLTWVSFVACFHRLCGSWSISCRDLSKLKGFGLRLHSHLFFNIIFQNVSGRGLRWLSCS